MNRAAPLIELLGDPHTVDDAARALHALGPVAIEALSAATLSRARPRTVREIAAELLGAIVPDGVSRLHEILIGGDSEQADLAAWGLRFLHDPAPTVAFLAETLRSDLAPHRARAARALRYAHVDLPKCPHEVVVALRDESASVRSDAVRLLIQLAQIGLRRYGIDPHEVRSALSGPDDGADPEARADRDELLSSLQATDGASG